jgi:ribosomal protein S18 acetylase RimI-like enzyme
VLILEQTLHSLQPDIWLSGLLDCPAWRVDRAYCGEPLSRLETSSPNFAYAKLKVEDINTASQLANIGFRVVDTALTFGGFITGSHTTDVRFAVQADRKFVSDIAALAFRFSRFHLDPLFPNGVADAIKSSWAANYFEGKRGDGMVVAERDNHVIGFLQLVWSNTDCLVIDLIGIAPAWQGQGIGRAMVQYAANYGTGSGRVPATMTVGTQAANTPSVRLYESLGFRLTSAQYVMHFHGPARLRQ